MGDTIITIEVPGYDDDNDDDNDNDNVCSICLIEIDGNDATTKKVACCNKRFHRICYTKWMVVNPTCPLCRREHDITALRLPTPLSPRRIHPIVIDITEEPISLQTIIDLSPHSRAYVNSQNWCCYCVCGIGTWRDAYANRKTIFMVGCLLAMLGGLLYTLINGIVFHKGG